ncbi:MAG: EAL domain-containing protein [Betaproteobacteria bacterium]|nr:EAL domain-containing protein [Betaproteobacteria bacterium]
MPDRLREWPPIAGRFLSYFALCAALVSFTLLCANYPDLLAAGERLKQQAAGRANRAAQRLTSDLTELGGGLRAVADNRELKADWASRRWAQVAQRLRRAAGGQLNIDRLWYLPAAGREGFEFVWRGGHAPSRRTAAAGVRRPRPTPAQARALRRGWAIVGMDMRCPSPSACHPVLWGEVEAFDARGGPQGLLLAERPAPEVIGFARSLDGALRRARDAPGRMLVAALGTARPSTARADALRRTPVPGWLAWAAIAQPDGPKVLDDQPMAVISWIALPTPWAAALGRMRAHPGGSTSALVLFTLAALVSLALAWMRTVHIRGTQALRRSQTELANAQALAHVGSWTWTVASGKVEGSAEFCRLFGLSHAPAALDLAVLLARVHPDDQSRIAQQLQAVQADGTPYTTEFRIVTPNHVRRMVSAQGEIATRNRDGSIRQMIGTVHDITARHEAEEAVRASEEAYRLLVEQAADGIVIADPDGIVIDANTAACRMLGMTHEGLLGQSIAHLVPADDVARVMAVRAFLAAHPGRTQVEEWSLITKDGGHLPVEVSAKILPDGRWQAIVRDITERKHTEGKLRQAATVFDNTNDGIIIADSAGRIIAVNRAFSDITGFAAEEVIAQNPRLLGSGHHDETFYREMWTMLKSTGQWRGEIWDRRKDGTVFPAWESISAVRDAGGQLTHYVAVFSDISVIKEAEAKLTALVHHDSLTGLPNRLLFSARLEQAMARADRHQQKVALMFIDLDRFKRINDTMGHAAGDELLRTIASRLRECVRKEDTVARLGGDEFTVLVEEIRDGADAASLADKIILAAGQPLAIDGKDITTSASIGIALYPEDAPNAEDLVRAADAAMYRAKERGRGNYQFYTSALTRRALHHLSVEQGLRRALERGEFVLYYQPQVALADETIVGAEALLRWRHPQIGLMLPEQFIPIADDAGLINALGRWALAAACAQMNAWHLAGLRPIRVGVNLSGRQIMQPDFAARIEQMLAAAGPLGDGFELELEITEGVRQIAEVGGDGLAALKGLGVSLAIDDFGTCDCSLSDLQQMPVSRLKIDRSFIHGIPGDANERSLTRAIIALGHSLDLRVVAAGIETREQARFLQRLGCDEGQGYLFGKAIAADAMARRLAQDSGTAPA